MIKSEKIVVDVQTKKEESFIESLIKDYKLKDDCFTMNSTRKIPPFKVEYELSQIIILLKLI